MLQDAARGLIPSRLALGSSSHHPNITPQSKRIKEDSYFSIPQILIRVEGASAASVSVMCDRVQLTEDGT